MNNHILLHPFVKSRKKLQKVFVFDFDETLGSFGHLFYLWNTIEKTLPSVSFELFVKLFDLYPEFLRCGILVILEYLYYKKINGKCYKIYIYTNNQCSINWVNMVIQYIGIKLKILPEQIPLFDKIVYAFKINKKVVEIERTTHKKTYQDFINCTILSNNTEICFIDDTYHPNMLNNKIYYIQPKPYNHPLSKSLILERLFDNLSLGYTREIIDGFNNSCKINDCIKTDYDKEVDNLISQRMMYYIKEFFYVVNTSSKTQKINNKMTKWTRKLKKYKYNYNFLESLV
jgi:hypothetical protein